MSKLVYQRYIFNEKSSPIDSAQLFLHIFCDAGEASYGIAAYVRYKTESGFSSHLIYSASKVAPSKNKLSIPKKELNAILLGCIKGEYLMNILKIKKENVILHTDSLVCMHWIRNNPDKLKVYVSNRVLKIQNSRFRIIYVPGELNPSDFVTKKTSVEKYLNNSFWQNGPKFLKENTEEILSKYQVFPNIPFDHLQEADKEFRPKIQVNNNVVKSGRPDYSNPDTLSNSDSHLIKLISRWSDFRKILRITALCLKAIALMTKGIKNSSRRVEIQQFSFSKSFIEDNQIEGIRNVLSPENIEAAKLFHVREAQKVAFEDYKILLNKDAIKESSKLAKLNPSINSQGIMIMNSRLDHHEFYPEQIRTPIILPKEQIITEQIVLDIHRRNAHIGPEICLREVKLQYWLTGGRREVRRCLKLCMNKGCRFPNLSPAKQLEANLPMARAQN